MAIELKDIEEVAKDLGAKFDEFKSVNDKRIDGIDQEKSKLSDTVEALNVKLTELESVKKDLEVLQKQQNRPGMTDAGQK